MSIDPFKRGPNLIMLLFESPLATSAARASGATAVTGGTVLHFATGNTRGTR